MSDNLNIENMNKIRLISKVAVQCDPRTLEKHKVVLELDWQSNADKTGYIAHIKDFKRVFIEMTISPQNENDPPQTVLKPYDIPLPGRKGPIYKTNAEASVLFGAIEHLIPAGLTYAERIIEEQRLGFHLYVNTDFIEDPDNPGQLLQGVTIYGLSEGDWEILRE